MAISLLGVALVNTLIGLENIGKNTKQYAAQGLTNAKIDRILALLEERDAYNMDLHRFITKLDTEIAMLIQSEAETATTAGERDLYYLFENRKHALKWAEEKSGHTNHTGAEALTVPVTAGMTARPLY